MTNDPGGDISSKTKKLSYNHEFIATCYHEAGHTISGLLNFMKIPTVSIEMHKKINADPTTLGNTNYETPVYIEKVKDDELRTELVMCEIRINYAGLAAEKLLYKDLCGTDQLPMVLKHGSFEDRDNISNLIKLYNLAPPGRKRHLFKKRALSGATSQLNAYWSDVKLVSHELYKRRKLYYYDLALLLTTKSINKKFWKKKLKEINFLSLYGEKLDERELKNILIP